MPPLAKWLPGARPRLQNHYSPAVFFRCLAKGNCDAVSCPEAKAASVSQEKVDRLIYLLTAISQLTEVQPVRNVRLPQLSTLIPLFGFLFFQ